ncbi:hypothetical protein FEI13_08270 [Halomonas urmiana]|uniref:Uncharacterized protein n=1 Tax=Halomonas urmiana TaxID=490901 RepID=A0A5R8MIH1_9GAMM|nr:hypothetical protein [Halomonas urmiana]TLF51652.1 hypothetical protein FEI13_08270 [Halomonas urmiana]
MADYTQLYKSALSLGVSDQAMTCNEAFLWYTEHWYDMDLISIENHGKAFLNELIFEFGPILPSFHPVDEDQVGEPIGSVDR